MVRGTNSTMKPLPVVALTDEDWSVWWWIMYTWPGGAIGRPAVGYYKADRRDAGLMFRAQGSRSMARRMTELDAVSPRWQWELIVELSDGEMGAFGGRML